MNHYDYNDRPRRLHRDSEHGIIFGVCAGLGDYFDCPVWLVRVAVVAIAWFLSVPAVIAYIVAGLVLPDRPLHYYGPGDERSFWQSHNRRS